MLLRISFLTIHVLLLPILEILFEIVFVRTIRFLTLTLRICREDQVASVFYYVENNISPTLHGFSLQ